MKWGDSLGKTGGKNKKLPVIEAHGVQQELNAILPPELLPVVLNDSGHVLDVTLFRRKQKAD